MNTDDDDDGASGEECANRQDELACRTDAAGPDRDAGHGILILDSLATGFLPARCRAFVTTTYGHWLGGPD